MDLVYLDVSGSTPMELIERTIKLAYVMNADIACFDTEIRCNPRSAQGLKAEMLSTLGRGGSDLNQALLGLQGLEPESYFNYDHIYVVSDLYARPPTNACIPLIEKVVFLAVGYAEETDQASVERFKQDITDPSVRSRTTVMPFDHFEALMLK
jgi:hypothetical protein